MNKSIIRAINNRQRLKMIYMDGVGRCTHRVIIPIKMNDDLVLAYCYTKRQVRTFKLDSVLSISPVNKRMGA